MPGKIKAKNYGDRIRQMFTVSLTNLLDFVFYSINGGGKLPWLMCCLS